MPTDLTVILENRPGTLADLGEALGRAGINIEGGCGFPCGGEGVAHILVEDAAAARRALEGAGLEVRAERPVLLVEVADRPGGLGSIARRLANAGVNVDLLYGTMGGQVVFGVDDLDKARIVV